MDPGTRSQYASLKPWLDLAGEGAVVLTSNQRAARYLLQQHTATARAQGRAGWETPRILTWGAWLDSIWEQITLLDASAPILLRPEQERERWLRAIASIENASPWNLDALASLSQQAWLLLHDYGVGLPALSRSSWHRPDWQQFQKWATKFSSENRRAGWLPQAQLSFEIERRLRNNQWQPPAQLVLWGFDQFTPAQESLLATIRSSSQVHFVPASIYPEVSGTVAYTLESPHQDAELRAATQWAHQRLQANPQARLAVITTQAADDRGAAYRIFSEQLAHNNFNFSLGFPLSHFPLVQTALLLLQWPWQPLLPQQVSSLLLSSSLSRSTESLLQLAQFDADEFLKRDVTDPAATLDNFARWLDSCVNKARGKQGESLLRQCRQALAVVPRRQAPATADTWADIFRQILAAFLFPGPLARDSANFQTHKRWEQLLDTFAGLSFDGEKFTAQQVLTRLQRMADETVFQPESRQTSVEVLGPLEAAGSFFDGIFFLSCTEDRWPIPVSPHPLLPLDLQQARAMPGAVRGANVTAARQMTERLLQSAPEVLFSFAQRGPEGELRPSPVLTNLLISTAPASLRQEICSHHHHPKPQLIQSVDLPPPRWQIARGTLDVSVLRSQAACPFQAFARTRLGVSDLKVPEDGLDALQRGTLVHELLRAVWHGHGNLPGLKTSSKLHELADANLLQQFVTERADALLSLRGRADWEREFILAERERITRLVFRWLTEVEYQRAPFKVSEAELSHEFSLEDLVTFKVRLDRVDELLQADDADSATTGQPPELILLDYKTGKVGLKGWLPPRLDEPQLPIYAGFAITSQPVAIAYAAVRAGKDMGLKGVAAREGVLPGVEPGRRPFDNMSFNELLQGWRDDITSLAGEFASGDARVNPKHGDDTCKYCGLQSLCRVAESGVLLDDDSDDADRNEGPDD